MWINLLSYSHIIFCSLLSLSHFMEHGLCYGSGPVNLLKYKNGEINSANPAPYGTSVYTYIPVMSVTISHYS
jgi:hypothetical protein